MKFKNGHWVVKKNIDPLYAVECCRAEIKENRLKLLIATQHVTGRGSTQTPTLHAELFSPMEGVIGVTLTHFRGKIEKPPFFVLGGDDCAAISIGGGEAVVKSGSIEARVSLRPNDWRIDYYCEGRRLTGDGFRMTGRMLDRSTDKSYIVQQLELGVGENVYGLGERFTAFVKNGQVVDMWNGDGGSCSELAYKNVPFYLTNRGYGVFVDSPSDVSFEVASEQVERVQFSLEGESMTYYVIAGPTPKEVMTRYTAMTGRAPLLPAWSFGLWLSTSFTTDYDEKTAGSFIDGMFARGIPLSVFHFDCFWMRGFNWCDFEWNREDFPDPEGMLARYHEKGLKICVWINPYVSQASPLFNEGLKDGYFICKNNGDVWQSDLWQGGLAVVDFTNPGARRWYREHLRKLLRMGVDCFKTDFGERIPVRDIAYFDGSDPVKMHNYYPQLYNEAVFSLIEEEKGSGNAVVFARSATAGGQMYPVHWGGDNFATYISMAETLRAGLSLASSGFAFWSHDISGFESTAPAHVYKRWCQFGLLSSHSRLHGSQSYRVPWLFDEEACVVLKRFVNLKMRLMPYIYSMAVKAHNTGVPIARPMFMEFPDDPGCDNLDRQYMFGDSILVAPVFREDGIVDYYLPEGKWTHLLDGRTLTGGRWIREKYDFMSLPLFARENSIIPMGSNDEKPDYDYSKGTVLRCYDVTHASFELYNSDGSLIKDITAVRKDGRLILNADYTYEEIKEDN